MPSDLDARPRATHVEGTSRRRVIRLIAMITLGLVGFLAFELGPSWLIVGLGANSRSLRREAVLVFMNVLLVAYIVTLITASAGTAVLSYLWTRLRKRGWPLATARHLQLRWLLLCTSTLLSLGILEAGAAMWRTWLHRSPKLPSVELGTTSTAPAAPTIPHIGGDPALSSQFSSENGEKAAGAQPLRILVIGESSGRGEPYQPWLSVGDIVGWRLEKVFPGRPIKVEMWARGGAILEEMHNKLAGLSYRPDALIVYLGHNEFQGRFMWGRDVDYYIEQDQMPLLRSPQLSAVASLLRFSPLCKLIMESRDRQRVDMVPPRAVTRELVDKPACTVEEFETIRTDFQRRWEAIAVYCELIGTLPIFIIPPSNDGGYDPSRSVLSADTPGKERIAFAASVAHARALEDKVRAQAIEIDRKLLERHPEFAETHYRLAQLLEKTGDWDEAKQHFAQARERDAMPLRCPEPFRQVIRDVAARHPLVVLVDGPRVLEAESRHGILDDHFFHDAQHPNLRGYVALSKNLLEQLGARRAFGWSADSPVPVVNLEICAGHYKIGPERLKEVCRREAWFFGATAYIRYDPVFRNERSAAYVRAAATIRDGQDAADIRIPGWSMPTAPSSSHRIPRRQNGQWLAKPK
jgi:Tetratricopeptide repeat